MQKEAIRKTMSDKKNKRLTMADRRSIEEGLRKHMSIAYIAKTVGKSWNAIANEIKRHKVSETTHYCVITEKNLCAHRDECAELERMRARTGVDCTEEQLIEMVKLVKPLMKKGQSLRHIWNTHGDELPVSMRTFYRYIDYGILYICNLDLPKRVK